MRRYCLWLMLEHGQDIRQTMDEGCILLREADRQHQEMHGTRFEWSDLTWTFEQKSDGPNLLASIGVVPAEAQLKKG